MDVNAVIAGMVNCCNAASADSSGGDRFPDLWPATSDPAARACRQPRHQRPRRVPDGGELRIGTGNVDRQEAARLAVLDRGDYVRIVVTDTGVGMTSDVWAR
jgi:hypothetical protein